jgi:hypothetical protein
VMRYFRVASGDCRGMTRLLEAAAVERCGVGQRFMVGFCRMGH